MQQWAYRTLSFLGLTGTGSGLGVVVPLTVEYSRDGDALEIFDLESGIGNEAGRSKRSAPKPEAKKISSTDDLLSFLFKRNERQIGYAYGGLGDLIKNRFKRNEEEQRQEWSDVKQSLADIKSTYENVIKWQQDWVNNQNKRIFEKFEELEEIVRDIKDVQSEVINQENKDPKAE